MGIRTIRIVFLLVGLGLLIGAAVLMVRTRTFVAEAVTASGTVFAFESRSSTTTSTTGNRRRTSTSVSYHPVVRFRTVEGREVEFTSDFGSNPAAYERGEEVEVLYDPAQPESAAINSFFNLYFIVLILGGIGAVFFAIGGGLTVAARRSAARRQWLEVHGRRVTATVNGIERNGNIKVGSRSPYRIVCQWQDPNTQMVHVFESDNIWFDPASFVRDTVEVLVDVNDHERYWVDTSFLPAKA